MKFSHLYLKRACEAFIFYGHESYCLGFIYFCSRRKIATCLICYLLLTHIVNVRHLLPMFSSSKKMSWRLCICIWKELRSIWIMVMKLIHSDLFTFPLEERWISVLLIHCYYLSIFSYFRWNGLLRFRNCNWKQFGNICILWSWSVLIVIYFFIFIFV